MTGFCWKTPVLVGLCASIGACAANRQQVLTPDQTYGHRYPDRQGGRLTLRLADPDTSQSYFYYPVVIDSVTVRAAPFAPDDTTADAGVPVEVLVKGSLPDACSDLDHVLQSRYGHLIDVRLEMRRPRGAVCAAVSRPFRFYFTLDDSLQAGSYSMKINGYPWPFEIRKPDPSS